MRVVVCVLTLMTLPAYAADTGDPSGLVIPLEVTQRAEKLIGRLGGTDPDGRNAAYKELDKLGRMALPAIEKILKSEKIDSELRTNLTRLRGPAMKEQFEASYQTFLADTENKYQHTFPGWDQLVLAAKDNNDSRKLMRDILSNTDCIDLIRVTSARDDDALMIILEHWKNLGVVKGEFVENDTRRPRQKYDYQRIPVVYFIALLLAESQIPAEVEDRYFLQHEIDNNRSNRIAQFGLKTPGNDESVRELSDKAKYGVVYRDICNYWVSSRTTLRAQYYGIIMCREFRLDDAIALKCSEKILLSKDAKAPDIKNAMSHLASSGKTDYLTYFERFLDDRSRCSTYMLEKHSELRDHALLYCVLASNQKPKEYGYLFQFEKTREANEDVFVRSSFNYAFESEQIRKAAFEKWADWKKKQNSR